MTRDNKYNFTLIEVILAVAIFAMVSLLIANILYSTQGAWGRIHKHSDKLDNLHKIDRVVHGAFKNTIPFKFTDPKLRERQIFQGEENSVIFAYLHRINNVKAGGIRFLKLSREDDKLIAEYRDTPILYWLDQPQTARVEKETLAENVVNVSFEYADRKLDEIVWYNDWDEEKKLQIPLAIQMTIEFKNGSRIRWLRRTAGSSYNSWLGKRDISGK